MYDDMTEFMNKIQWEGGIEEAIEYGLSSDDIPESETDARELWESMIDAYDEFSVLKDEFNSKYGR